LAIRTLIFDLGKVIVDFSFDEAYSRMRAASGLTDADIRARFLHGSLMADFETGRIGSQAFVAEVNHRMGTQLTMKNFSELWASIFHPAPILGVELLRSLRQQHRLILLSNTNELHFETIRESYPHVRHFDALVLSHEVGVMKPDRAIYELALQQAQCAANECLFFDDLAENIAGARAAGLNARQFVGREKLLCDLAEFGVGLE
jgi:glucose-1-phosphatase